MHTVTFDPRWQTWRRQAREALLAERAPDQVLWSPDEPDSQAVLPLGPPTGDDDAQPAAASRPPQSQRGVHVPPDFVRLGRLVAHHRSAARWDLLYRLLWRLQHGEHELLDDMLDPDVFRLRRMAAAVREDLKETRAQLHFWSPGAARPRRRGSAEPIVGDRLPDMVSWCQPGHRILPLLAEDFAARYPERSFALLSPDGCAFWDTASLELGPGIDRRAARSPAEIAQRWAERRRAAA